MILKLWNNKLLVIVVLFLFGICAYIYTSKNNDMSETIRIAILGEPTTLDPNFIEGGTWERMVLQDAFTGLFENDENGNIIPALVDKYEVSKDGTLYTFYLKDTKWSDGVKLTAYDFQFSYKRMLDPNTPAIYAYYHFPIKNAEQYKLGKVGFDQVGVKVLDEKTLQIKLEKPMGYFITTLSHPATFPIPQHIVEKYGKSWSNTEHIVSNGAYKISSWKLKSYIKSIKNDLYFDANKVHIKNIIYYTQEDRSSLLKRYRAGEIDILDDFPSDQYTWLKANYPNDIRISPFSAIYFIAINMDNPYLKNIKVREALNLAIDRKIIVEKILKTGETQAYSLSPFIGPYNPAQYNLRKISQDDRIKQAKKLITSLGFDNKKPLQLNLSYTNDENDKKIIIAVADMWAKIGVKVNLVSKEIAIHYQELHNQNFELGRVRWLGHYADPATFLEIFQAKVANNFGNYNNSQYDYLFKKASATLNEKERNLSYKQAEQLLLNDYAFIPLFFNTKRILLNPRVYGWEPNILNIHLVKYMSLK